MIYLQVIDKIFKFIIPNTNIEKVKNLENIDYFLVSTKKYWSDVIIQKLTVQDITLQAKQSFPKLNNIVLEGVNKPKSV